MSMTTPSIDSGKLGELASTPDGRGAETVFTVKDLSVTYSGNLALKGVTLDIQKNFVTAFIGPSGCGKSTFIRCFNRMNDLVPGAVVDGEVLYHGRDLYGSNVDPVEVRRRIGMVFQKPNPFPKSIYDNIAFGPRILKMTKDLDERVERTLRHAALWDEVKDRLKENALGLSGGQQQRLCIARALAVEPDVILMDEPASALDPISTSRIEDLIHELKNEYTIVIVTHNMQQAARVADMTAFFSVELREDGSGRHGVLVEYDQTTKVFTNPARQAHRGLRHGAVRLTMARIEFQASLDSLEATLQEQGSLVLRALRGAVDVLASQDAELCDEVVAFDDEVDARYHGIEKSIGELLAQQSPVATDLRLVLAILHDSIHLERIGDQCVTIAKLTKLASELEPHHDLVEGLTEMGERAEEMVRIALDSFSDARRRAGPRARRARRADRPHEPARLRPGAQDGEHPGHAGVGHADDRRLALHRADRRQRRRHRRADRVPRHRRVPRVHRRLALTDRVHQPATAMTPESAPHSKHPAGKARVVRQRRAQPTWLPQQRERVKS